MKSRSGDLKLSEILQLERWAHEAMTKSLGALARIQSGEKVPQTFVCADCSFAFYTNDILAELYRRSPRSWRATWSGKYRHQPKVSKIFDKSDLLSWYSYIVNAMPETFANKDYAGEGYVREHIFGYTLAYFRYEHNVFEFLVPRDLEEIALKYGRNSGKFIEVYAEDVVDHRAKNKPHRVAKSVEILEEKRKQLKK